MTMQNRQHAHASLQEQARQQNMSNPGMPSGAHAQLYLCPTHPALILPTNELILEYSEMKVGRVTELMLYGSDAVFGTWKRFKNLLIPDLEDLDENKLILPISMDTDDQKRRNSRQGNGQEDDQDSQDTPDRAVDSMSRSIRKWLWE
jgi:hypothetical protein